ncbi:MAG: hypothetical protein LBB55_06585 [Zoogloeaceae bacterium]|jgi:UDP-3-O-[3-hydroxymyristoyl] glucosamine N-acyltransferase|nr:hypothetical protein [Zoogloeaceae bacterium]
MTNGISLAEIAARLDDILPAEIRGDGRQRVSQVGTLQGAGDGQIAFLSNPKYKPHLKTTRASAVILSPDMADGLPATVSALLTGKPYLYYAHVAALLNPPGKNPPASIPRPGWKKAPSFPPPATSPPARGSAPGPSWASGWKSGPTRR